MRADVSPRRVKGQAVIESAALHSGPPPSPQIWPQIAIGWYHACHRSELRAGPVRIDLGDQSIAVFQTARGEISAIDARCVHLGADLSRGCVVGETLRCPFHEWSFNGRGQCVHIPASTVIPAFARQAAFATATAGEHVFVFNGPEARYDLPFYDGLQPADLYAARPFVVDANMDWWMVASNGFDLQHFRAAHDRTLVGEPVVESPSPFARRITASFDVTGQGWRDRLTRVVSGPRVTMSVTSWGGTLVLVTARFRRTTSYGMVCITPAGLGRSRLRIIVWVTRSQKSAGRLLFDPLNAAIRRSFIRAFVRSDQERSEGICYSPASLIDADRTLADYFEWLAGLVRAGPR
jgi:phenylpropionate dioxygenase-like ring-hydroxylating dioxygenase large terminal subunit